MADRPPIGDEQLALLLQASRDFALKQLAESGGFLPFGAQVNPDGEIEFVRMADENMPGTMDEFFMRLVLGLAERARRGEIIAATTVLHIELAGSGVEPGPGFEKAIRVHVEAPGFSRLAIAPYRIEQAEEPDGQPFLVDAPIVPLENEAVIFAA